MTDPDLKKITDAYHVLNQHPDFKVLMRLPDIIPTVQPQVGEKLINGLYVDVETTGLKSDRHEVIEIALIPFLTTAKGELASVSSGYSSFNEPVKSEITTEITRITGITPEMVKGQKIDTSRVKSLVVEADIVVAHNAQFDRGFCEKLDPVFETKCWACSMEEIAWKELGFGGKALEYLCLKSGFYYDAHRADTDCRAAIYLLSKPLPNGEMPLKVLMDTARKSTFRIWAENAPYDMKDILKDERSYKWNDGEDGRPKAWWKDITEEKVVDECKYLKDHIYRREVDIFPQKITAFSRYSKRI